MNADPALVLAEHVCRTSFTDLPPEAVIATKCLPRPAGEHYEPGRLAARIREGAELSLRRLGTDRIDLYQLHGPDADTPIEETLEALNALVKAGKVREIGNSNFDGAQIRAADKRGSSG